MDLLDRSVKGGARLFTHKGAWEFPESAVTDTRKAEPVALPYPRQPTIGFLSPPAIFQSVVEAGAEKARQPWWKTFWLGILAGIYLSLGGALALAVGGTLPLLQQNGTPGLQKLIFAAIGLPLGLGLIIICGAELYTANAAWLPAAVFEGRANMTQLAKNWFFSYFGNLCGCLIVVWLVDETFLWDNPSARVYPASLAHLKAGAPWGSEVVRAMGANLLVCLAAWQAQASQDIVGKIFGIFFPVLAFVSIGFSHVIANMFWVPFGIKTGMSDISVGRYIVHSMIPDWIGNTIVAAFVLAGSYSFCYGTAAPRLHRRWLKLTGKLQDEPYANDSAHESNNFGPHDKAPQQAHGRKVSHEDGTAPGV